MAATSGRRATLTLPTDEQILVTREFDAPRHLLYEAWTAPEHIRRWWAGRRGKVTVADVDLRVGGAWRYAMVATGGHEVAFHGEFREIVPGERLVYTEIYEAMPDAMVVNTVTFTEKDGRTVLEMLTDCPTKEIRDGIVQSGMEGGLQEQMQILDEILAALR